MRLLLISGGLREGSTNTAALRTLQDIAPAGVDARLYEGTPDRFPARSRTSLNGPSAMAVFTASRSGG